MTAAKTAAPSTYQSGFCSVRAHERCRGQYAGCDCTCGCHSAPTPAVLGEIAAALTEIAIAAAVERHCPTCTCGDAEG